MFERFNELRKESWKTVTTGQMAVVSVGSVVLFYSLKTEGFIAIILDSANLMFHEAGHPIFGLLGSTMELYGGTLGQLVFPAVTVITFWTRREAIGCMVGSVWAFENFLNIARYMADARAQVLPLVGGGEHDWANIFTRWGVLPHDTAIAQAVQTVGWLGMIGAWGWLIWRWLRSEPNGV